MSVALYGGAGIARGGGVLVDAERRLTMHSVGREVAMGREFLCLNFSSLAIKYKFYFTNRNIQA